MKIDWLFVKFLFVGVLNTLFGYFVFALLLFIGLHYSVAVVFSTVLGILFNFKTTGILVFKNNDNKLIFKFITVYAIICCINIALLKVAKLLNLNLYYAGLFLTFLMAIFAFVLNKNWVFKLDEKN